MGKEKGIWGTAGILSSATIYPKKFVVLELKLEGEEKKSLVAFMRQL